MSSFVNLTLALEGLFDEPLSALPEALRQRVEAEFCPTQWDELSVESRRIVALQRDYQHGPETEKERRVWWEWASRIEAIMAQIAEWEATATPTALDLTEKQKRLAELRQELASVKTEDIVGAIESDTANQTKLALDLTVLATPAQLLSAFGVWGLKKTWFNCLGNHDWLLEARVRVGVGGNNSKAPLFCPLRVMIGLTTRTKPRKGSQPRTSLEKGWKLLKINFPLVYQANAHLAPDDDQG